MTLLTELTQCLNRIEGILERRTSTSEMEQRTQGTQSEISTTEGETDTWTLVTNGTKRIKNTSKDLLDSNIRVQNYFGPLAFINNGPPEVNYDDDEISGIEKGVSSTQCISASSSNSSPVQLSPIGKKTQSSKQQLSKKRPSPVIAKHTRNTIPVMPGHKSYNKAHINTVSVVTDSMTRSIRQKTMNEHLSTNVEVNFHKYPGHTADEIGHYVYKNIEDDKPNSIIIVAGINDILKAKREKDVPNLNEIIENILDIGRVARDKAVKNIFISGIMVNRNKSYNQVVNAINDLLGYRCKQEGFNFIDQSHIVLRDLWHDGLHLNEKGSAKLLYNLLSCCEENYNPYLY